MMSDHSLELFDPHQSCTTSIIFFNKKIIEVGVRVCACSLSLRHVPIFVYCVHNKCIIFFCTVYNV